MEAAKEVEGTSTEVASPLSRQDTSSFLFSERAASPSDYSIFPRDTAVYRTQYVTLTFGPQYEAKRLKPPALLYGQTIDQQQQYSK